MCLTGACLAIRHDHSVEPVQHVRDNGVGNLSVCIVLASVHVKHAVESEVALIEAWPYKRDRLVIVRMVSLNALHAALFPSLRFLLDEERPDSDDH